jgi:hypothetical protein
MTTRTKDIGEGTKKQKTKNTSFLQVAFLGPKSTVSTTY